MSEDAVSEQLGLLGRAHEDDPMRSGDALAQLEESYPDLIGFEFAGIRVTGYAPWNPAYLYVETPDGPSCRATSLVRARMADG